MAQNYPPPYGPQPPPPPGPRRHTEVTKRGANHSLHVLLTVLTCGLWAITGWPIAAAMGRKTKTTVTVTPAAPSQGPYAAPQPHPGPQAQQGPYGPPQGPSWPPQGQYPPQGQPPAQWGQYPPQR